MENAGSKDLFVFYEMLLWGIKEGNMDFIKDQIEINFRSIVKECMNNKRV